MPPRADMADSLVVEVHLEEDVELPVSAERIAAAVRHTLALEGVSEAEVSLAFLSDAEIARMNQEHLGHEGVTDVISFPLHGPGGTVVGDIYVGAEQAVRQAQELRVPAAEEVLRLAIHGTLHVLGYDHPEGEDREQSPMYRRQEEVLDLFLGR